MNRNKKILMFSLLFINLVCLGILVALFSSKSPSLSAYMQKNIWYSKIKAVGAKTTYAELLSTYARDSATTQHAKAHDFGNALYAVEGEKGITICDNSFGFGCYHSFFISALMDKGEKIIPTLYQTCIHTYGIRGTGCQHGIGHGILEYTSPDNVLSAVRLCDKIQTFTYLGCSDGVFMDYFFPLEQTSSGLTLSKRTLDPQNPLYPCNHVTSQYALSCYYELGRYLGVGKDSSVDCGIIDNSQQETACFMGFGGSIMEGSNYDIKKATQACKESQNALSCMIGAAWSLYSNPKTRSKQELLCDNSENENECMTKADLTQYRLML